MGAVDVKAGGPGCSAPCDSYGKTVRDISKRKEVSAVLLLNFVDRRLAAYQRIARLLDLYGLTRNVEHRIARVGATVLLNRIYN